MLTVLTGVAVELAVIAWLINSSFRSVELLRRHFLDALAAQGIGVWVPDGYRPLDSRNS